MLKICFNILITTYIQPDIGPLLYNEKYKNILHSDEMVKILPHDVLISSLQEGIYEEKRQKRRFDLKGYI